MTTLKASCPSVHVSVMEHIVHTPISLQRPTAHELLKHRFLKVARKTSYLTELIDRYQRWRVESGESDDLDDSVDGGR